MQFEGPISTGVSNKLNNIDSNNGILISKKYYTIYTESTVDIHRKNTVNKKKYVVQKVHTKKDSGGVI